jgi:hypothetical protein
MKSKTASEDPKRAIPYTDNEEPKRAIARRDSDEPIMM